MVHFTRKSLNCCHPPSIVGASPCARPVAHAHMALVAIRLILAPMPFACGFTFVISHEGYLHV